jgi:hypothetical protein
MKPLYVALIVGALVVGGGGIYWYTTRKGRALAAMQRAKVGQPSGGYTPPPQSAPQMPPAAQQNGYMVGAQVGAAALNFAMSDAGQAAIGSAFDVLGDAFGS